MSVLVIIILFHATNIHKLLAVYKIIAIFVSEMRKINRTYKFRLYPTKVQADLLARHFGCARFVYNYFSISVRNNIGSLVKAIIITHKPRLLPH